MSVCVQRPIEGLRAPGISSHKVFDYYSPVSPMCFARSTLGELNKPGIKDSEDAGPCGPAFTSSIPEHSGHGEHIDQSPDISVHSNTRVLKGVPAVKATAAPQSLPCSRFTLTASPTPFTVLSASANTAATPLECFNTPTAPQHEPSVAEFPAAPEEHMPHAWGDTLPAVAEDAAALPCQDPVSVLHERVSEESNVSGKKKRRRHGVLSLLKDVCKSLMGTRSVAPLPAVEELAVPVSRLEDDTPLVAWRQEYYVQSRLQHSPQLTVGEARAEFLRRSFEQNIRLIGASAPSCSGGVSPPQQEAYGAPCVPDELLSELSVEEDALPCHPLQDLDAALDEAWFFGSFSTPAPSYAGSCCSSWHG